MHISVATANYYHLPFEQALEIIAQAGFQYIELDLYWEHKPWAMAQHLRGWSPRDISQAVNRSGLRAASIHDAGGLLEHRGTLNGFIDPLLAKILGELGYAPDTLVFHTPHVAGEADPGWWQGFSGQIIAALEPYRRLCRAITIENMLYLDGYFVPLVAPQDLLGFVSAGDLGVTLDTTHYAHMGTDISQAAQTLYGKVKTVHFSDYEAGQGHLFPGDGQLDFPRFFQQLDPAALQSITLECTPGHKNEERASLGHAQMIERLKEAKDWVERSLPSNFL
jgi:sugar phosphate isomerase/epimerase